MSLETPLLFTAEGARLLGILHRPDMPPEIGVLIVVGGPQYRIGAHRQFVHLARALANRGIAVLRFDYRGLGDSEGEFAGFDHIDADIDAALAALRDAVPSLKSIVLWGLCDAASAILMKARHAPDIKGLVVLNPWVRTVAGEARAYIRHYYLRRALSGDFWKKVLTGRFRAGSSLKDMSHTLGQARQGETGSLPARVLAGIRGAKAPLLLILSGNDLVAREFEDQAGREVTTLADGRALSLERLEAADHTFSRAEWKNRVADITYGWIVRHVPPGPS